MRCCSVYVDAEEKQLRDTMEALVKEETWQPMEDAQQTNVLRSSSELFAVIKRSLTRCSKFVSTGAAMLQLCNAFQVPAALHAAYAHTHLCPSLLYLLQKGRGKGSITTAGTMHELQPLCINRCSFTAASWSITLCAAYAKVQALIDSAGHLMCSQCMQQFAENLFCADSDVHTKLRPP